MIPELDTPFLAVDEHALDRNLRRGAERAAARGLAWRPHAKTHKSLEIARRQLAAGATGLTVATVGEAEVFAEVCDDLFLAYPIHAAGPRAARLRALADRVRLRIGVDSAEGVRTLAEAVGGAEVLIEIDSGHHRTGVGPAEAGALAVAARDAGLAVIGVFTFPGHSYSPDGRRAAADDETAALDAAAASLADAGVEARVRSGGSSPTEPLEPGHARYPATETRPGVSVFGDAQQLELGAADVDDVALTAVATVVSTRSGIAVLDAGSKVLGADRAPWASGYGHLLDHPDATVTALSEHHATVTFPGDAPRVGDRVRVVPNHVCAAVNLAEELVLVDGGTVTARWAVEARGANT